MLVLMKRTFRLPNGAAPLQQTLAEPVVLKGGMTKGQTYSLSPKADGSYALQPMIQGGKRNGLVYGRLWADGGNLHMHLGMPGIILVAFLAGLVGFAAVLFSFGGSLDYNRDPAAVYVVFALALMTVLPVILIQQIWKIAAKKIVAELTERLGLSDAKNPFEVK